MDVIRACGHSHCGLQRRQNQDHYLIAETIAQSDCWTLFMRDDDERFRTQGLICAVADGMGGTNGGAQASRLALETLAEDYSDARDPDGLWLSQRMLRAHDRVRARGAEDPSLQGMGTTIVGVYLAPGVCTAFHAGDSRLYRFRDGYLAQITIDHTPEGASQILQKNQVKRSSSIVTNGIGGHNDALCQPDIKTSVSFRAGDILLLCSDGLTDAVSNETLEGILRAGGEPERRVIALIAAANDAGGPDNITVVLITQESDE